MKKILDWRCKEVANIYDEVSLWSAPFGRLLLENIPMKRKANIVDIGFGTGFPLIELSQRFGEGSTIYGIDIWKAGVECTKEKIRVLEIKNIEIIEESASATSMEDGSIDLITSNLGVNNFEEKEAVYLEIKRMLKKGGSLCITTNPKGIFGELFVMFSSVFAGMSLHEGQSKLKEYVEQRDSEASIVAEFEAFNFKLVKSRAESTMLRFVDAEAMPNHSLVRIGFREHWGKMVGEGNGKEFFKRLVAKINDVIERKGEFVMSIPMLYLEFEKQ